MATKSDLPSFEQYFVPALQALKKRGGSATIEELEEDVAQLMRLTDDVLSVPHKGSSRSQFNTSLRGCEPT
jgi:restriction system protein